MLSGEVDVLPELSEYVLAGGGHLDPHVHEPVAAPAHRDSKEFSVAQWY